MWLSPRGPSTSVIRLGISNVWSSWNEWMKKRQLSTKWVQTKHKTKREQGLAGEQLLSGDSWFLHAMTPIFSSQRQNCSDSDSEAFCIGSRTCTPIGFLFATQERGFNRCACVFKSSPVLLHLTLQTFTAELQSLSREIFCSTRSRDWVFGHQCTLLRQICMMCTLPWGSNLVQKSSRTLKNWKPSTVSLSAIGHQADQALECFHIMTSSFLPTATTSLKWLPPGLLIAYKWQPESTKPEGCWAAVMPLNCKVMIILLVNLQVNCAVSSAVVMSSIQTVRKSVSGNCIG